MPDYVRLCEEFAREAGDVLRQWQGQITPCEKAPADLVTEADVASQRLIETRIAAEFPDHGFLGEEGSSANTPPESTEFCWVVDPLDGTTNYVHGLSGWCVSIGLMRHGRPLAGCVYDPDRDMCFTAARGEGAFRDGARLKTSPTATLSESLVAVSFPAGVERDSPEVGAFLRLLPAVRAFRRLGSAALNLCYVAAGQLDAYWTGSIHPWDAAAGVLIVEEAGGVATTVEGEPPGFDLHNLVAASTPALHGAMIAQLGGEFR